MHREREREVPGRNSEGWTWQSLENTDDPEVGPVDVVRGASADRMVKAVMQMGGFEDRS